MKNLTKLIVISVFSIFALGLLITNSLSKNGDSVYAQADVTPTPPGIPSNAPLANATPAPTASSPANVAANTMAMTNSSPGDKTIPKTFTLGQDSISEHGEVAFDHNKHAFQKYSPDGKSVVGCITCHHTDQPKSALMPPLVTSEREVAMTLESWQKSPQQVSLCRACHFQKDEVPDGKEMPQIGEKILNNEIAYHDNCNTCHDAAANLRPELKKKAGFATTNDCFICHKEN